MNMLSVSLILATLSSAAYAHEAWVALEGSRHAVFYGHLDKPVSSDPAKIRMLSAFDRNGKSLATDVQAGTPMTVAAPGAALFVLDFDNGVWTKTTEGSKNLPKRQVPGALFAAHSLKYGKTVLTWSQAVGQPRGQRFEVVPLFAEAPQAGSSVSVQVLYEGKPLADATVQLEGYERPSAKTDANGKATLSLGKSGMQMLVAQHTRHIATADADDEKLSANLVFEAR